MEHAHVRSRDEAEAVMKKVGFPVELCPVFSLDARTFTATSWVDALSMAEQALKASPTGEITIKKVFTALDIVEAPPATPAAVEDPLVARHVVTSIDEALTKSLYLVFPIAVETMSGAERVTLYATSPKTFQDALRNIFAKSTTGQVVIRGLPRLVHEQGHRFAVGQYDAAIAIEQLGFPVAVRPAFFPDTPSRVWIQEPFSENNQALIDGVNRACRASPTNEVVVSRRLAGEPRGKSPEPLVMWMARFLDVWEPKAYRGANHLGAIASYLKDVGPPPSETVTIPVPSRDEETLAARRQQYLAALGPLEGAAWDRDLDAAWQAGLVDEAWESLEVRILALVLVNAPGLRHKKLAPRSHYIYSGDGGHWNDDPADTLKWAWLTHPGVTPESAWQDIRKRLGDRLRDPDPSAKPWVQLGYSGVIRTSEASPVDDECQRCGGEAGEAHLCGAVHYRDSQQRRDDEDEWRAQNGVSRGNVPAPGDKCGHNRCLGTLRATETAFYVRCDKCAVRQGPGPGALEALETAEHNGRQDALREGGYEKEINRLMDEREMREGQIEEIHAALGHCDEEWSNCHDLGTCAVRAAEDMAARVVYLTGEAQEQKNRASNAWEIFQGRRRGNGGTDLQPVEAYVMARTICEAGDVFCRMVGGVGGAYSFYRGPFDMETTAGTSTLGALLWAWHEEQARRSGALGAVLWTSLPPAV